ncbi:MAG: alpha/beta hydrolase [Chloroflexi bacterium]|nr:alpha/beta hydrolase [Chloroflexota bacterium]
MPTPIFEYGGQPGQPVMHLALANGFPPQTYQPLLRAFTDRFQVLTLLPRPLWPDGAHQDGLSSWADMADDYLAGMHEHKLSAVIALGHSMGGIAAMLNVLAEPERFRALILLDPTLISPLALRGIALTRVLGMASLTPLSRKALRRRDHFPDEQSAFDYWRGKGLFRDWSDETLWLYTRGLTQPSSNGTGLELAWSRDWEAKYYRTIYTQSYQRMRDLNGLVPTLFIRGGTSSAFSEAAARRVRSLLPDAELRVLDGEGHLFPQAAPIKTYTMIAEWLAAQDLI